MSDDDDATASTPPPPTAPDEKRSGVIYLQTIPPLFTVRRIRETFAQFGDIGRIYLQAEKRRLKDGKKLKKFAEGWIEFADKKLAKRVAASLNNTPVGGRRRSLARESLWSMKYLNGFRWMHLNEQLTYERKVEQQRMRAEISQAKREASFFAEQVEKGQHLKRLEERVLKKGGLWEKYQRQIEQRTTVRDKTKTTKKNKSDAQQNDKLLDFIFTE